MRRLESVPEVEDEREKSACSALPHMYCKKKERMLYLDLGIITDKI